MLGFSQEEKYVKYVLDLNSMLNRYYSVLASLNHAEVSGVPLVSLHRKGEIMLGCLFFVYSWADLAEICCSQSTVTGLKIDKINRKKTKLMKMNTTASTPVTVGGEPIREAESFVYLGSVVDQQGGTDRNVTAGKASAAFVMLKKHLGIWRNQHENETPHLQLQCEVSPALRM